MNLSSNAYFLLQASRARVEINYKFFMEKLNFSFHFALSEMFFLADGFDIFRGLIIRAI